VTVRIHSPEGAVGSPAIAPAPGPELLAGRRLAVLDNGKPGAALLLGRAAERLAARTGAIFAGLRRKGSAATPCEEELLRELAGEAELVLTGTAD
jgi:hypothetical protein